MPNWVENDLRITADEMTMTAIRERILTDEGVLSFALLIPEEFDNPAYRASAKESHLALAEGDTIRDDGTLFDWYNFRIDHWGCKWDVSKENFSIAEESATELNIFFLSPWSPPTAWFHKLRETFPDAKFGMSSSDPWMEESWEDGEPCL